MLHCGGAEATKVWQGRPRGGGGGGGGRGGGGGAVVHRVPQRLRRRRRGHVAPARLALVTAQAAPLSSAEISTPHAADAACRLALWRAWPTPLRRALDCLPREPGVSWCRCREARPPSRGRPARCPCPPSRTRTFHPRRVRAAMPLQPAPAIGCGPRRGAVRSAHGAATDGGRWFEARVAARQWATVGRMRRAQGGNMAETSAAALVAA